MKKAVVSILSALSGGIIGMAAAKKIENNKFDSVQKMSDKHFTMFLMMNQWIKLKQQGIDLSSSLRKKGYRRIAIYGMSYIGERLVDELKNSDVKVVYGIDKRKDIQYMDMELIHTDDDWKPVDAVIVTAPLFFNQIREEFAEKVNCPIVSLEDILYEVQ